MPPKKLARCNKDVSKNEKLVRKSVSMNEDLPTKEECVSNNEDLSKTANPVRKRVRINKNLPRKEMPGRKRLRFAASLLWKNRKQDYNLCDPVGRHLLALRTFYRGLLKPRSQSKKKPVVPVSQITIPEYPAEYPTHEFLALLHKSRHNRLQLHFKNHLSKEKVDLGRKIAIKKILLQIGFDDEQNRRKQKKCEEEKNDDEEKPLDVLSHVTDVFLKSFMDRIRYHKDSNAFCKSQDLWDSLETTLHDFGYGGIHGIGKYYYGEFVKMQESVYDDCRKRLAYMALLESRRKQRALKKNANKIHAVDEGKDCNATIAEDKDCHEVKDKDDGNPTIVKDSDCNAVLDKH